jgi:hypothetical protein
MWGLTGNVRSRGRQGPAQQLGVEQFQSDRKETLFAGVAQWSRRV